jgi:hypothetical protein
VTETANKLQAMIHTILQEKFFVENEFASFYKNTFSSDLI